MNNLNILFFFMMIISSLISISSTNWLGAWMGLELNMLSFIPLIINNKNILSNESALKYFLIQAIASCSFLSFCLLNTFYSSMFSNINSPLTINILMTLPLILKLGAAPFQAWFVMVMEGIDWFKCLLLMTWQKIAPIFIMFYITKLSIIMPFCILSLIIGSISGLNQTSFKKIMAYSSVNHLGWLMSSMFLNKFLLIFYFLMYFILNMFTVLNLMELNLTNFSQSFFSKNIHLSVSLMSLAGLPPFLGFLPKWLIINNLINNNMYMLSFIMIMTALITTFFYIRITFNSMIMSLYTQKWNVLNTKKSSMTQNFLLMVSSSSLVLFNLLT